MGSNNNDFANDDLADFHPPEGGATSGGLDLGGQGLGTLFITGAISGDTLAQIVDSLCMTVANSEVGGVRDWAMKNADSVLAEVLGRSRAVHG